MNFVKKAMISVIVYTSKTGNTRKYAQLLSEKINLPAYSEEDAKKNLPKGSQIIYMGWIIVN